jgi:hypothetical protein
MDKQSLLQEIHDTRVDLLQVLDAISEEQFNRVPFADSWTAGQVAEHAFKALSGVARVLQGDKKPADRQPDARVDELRTLFLNFSIKMKSPDFILPSEGPHNKEKLTAALQQTLEELYKLTTDADLSMFFTSFELPGGGGPLTGWEWVNFGIVHTKRHTHQLQNILSALL